MANEIKIFENEEFGKVRTVDINGEPYFVARDIANKLGYSNPTRAIRNHVDEEDKTETEMVSANGTKAVLIHE